MMRNLTRWELEALLELVDDRRAELTVGTCVLEPGTDRHELADRYSELYEKLNTPDETDEDATPTVEVPRQRLPQGSAQPVQLR